MKFFSELKRRNVLRMAALYVVAAWLVMQVTEVLISLAPIPDWAGQLVLTLLAIGLPIALLLSWFYELTPEGISPEAGTESEPTMTRFGGRRVDFVVISLLAAGLIMFAWDKWWPDEPMGQSIAVLPFQNMSGNPEQEYYSDGISVDVLNSLAQADLLRVIARTSSFSFKGENVDIATVAEKLKVSHVLEGTIRRSGDKVRITAQLIDVADSTNIWAGSFDRTQGEVFDVQEDIVASVLDALNVDSQPGTADGSQEAAARTSNAGAYDSYLRGRELVVDRQLEEAVIYLERSLRLDSDFAPAHAELAIAYTLQAEKRNFFYMMPVDEVQRRATPHLERAIELAPDMAETHAAQAIYASLIDARPELQIEYAQRALATNPSYVNAMNWLQMPLNDLGRYKESDEVLGQMLIIDPLNFIGLVNERERLARRAEYEEAQALANRLLEGEDPWWGYSAHKDTLLKYQGDLVNGLVWSLKSDREGGRTGFMTSWAFSLLGIIDEARRGEFGDNLWLDIVEGKHEELAEGARTILEARPENEAVIDFAASALYIAGYVDEALPLLEQQLSQVPEGRPINNLVPLLQTMRLADARRRAGDEHGAQVAAQITRQDIFARRAAGRNYWELDLAEAMIFAFNRDADRTVAHVKSAVQNGFRMPQLLDEPIFEAMQTHVSFIEAREELDEILLDAREQVLQIICFNNPVPDDWRPLPQTCRGVEKEA